MEGKESKASLDNVKVLVYEEDEVQIQKIKEFLNRRGAEVVIEQKIQNVKDRIEDESPNVLLIGGKELLSKENYLRSISEVSTERDIPFILLIPPTPPSEIFSIEVDDWLTYPITESMLIKRVSLQLMVRRLEEEVDNVEKVLLYIAQTVEMKELYGREHPQRVAKVALDIGELFDLDEKSLTDLKMGALLHDIGKVGVPETLLSKPGKLTPPEYEEIKKHAIIGERLCRPVGFLSGALPVIRHHHERWDGAGYPDGLSGEEIPLLARIVSVADAFVAFTSDRPFRKAFTKGEVLAVLVGGAGSYWDPSVIWALLRILPR